MSQVMNDGITCPICDIPAATSDLDTTTNEIDFYCLHCGYRALTQIVERFGIKYWKEERQFPMDENGVVQRGK
jgi:hypothetical protein